MFVNKKTKMILIATLIFLILLIVTPFAYVQANKRIYAQRVTDYLLQNQNYKREEIQSVQGVWGKKLPSFYAVVVFKDEPQVEYVYFAHNDVIQVSYRLTQEGKEKDMTEKDLKHYDPGVD